MEIIPILDRGEKLLCCACMRCACVCVYNIYLYYIYIYNIHTHTHVCTHKAHCKWCNFSPQKVVFHQSFVISFERHAMFWEVMYCHPLSGATLYICDI